MSDWQAAPYKDNRWIVADPLLLGGKLAIRGTRLSVSQILECLANGMSLEDIDQAFDHAFPHEALPEILKLASELTDSFHVAACEKGVDGNGLAVALVSRHDLPMTCRVVLEHDPETGDYSAVCPELLGCASAGETEEEAQGEYPRSRLVERRIPRLTSNQVIRIFRHHGFLRIGAAGDLRSAASAFTAAASFRSEP